MFYLRSKILLLLVVALPMLSCVPIEKTDPGVIRMTAKALDQQLLAAYSDGYSAAKAEAPAPADVELKLFTQSELTAFLKKDQCDRCCGNNSCLERVQCLTKNVRAAKYDVYGVILNFKEGEAHAIAGFPMKDGSVIYIDPQFDLPVTIAIGMNYIDNFYGHAGNLPKTIDYIGVLY